MTCYGIAQKNESDTLNPVNLIKIRFFVCVGEIKVCHRFS